MSPTLRFTPVIAGFALGLALVLTGRPAAAQVKPPSVTIANVMTPREIEATGLRTMSPEQVEALTKWLDSYLCAVTRMAVEPAGEDAKQNDREIHTRIDGYFDGWVGDTVFKLQNGQIWQQVSPSAQYLFAFEPKVTISAAPHRLKVEGLPVEIAVRRIR